MFCVISPESTQVPFARAGSDPSKVRLAGQDGAGFSRKVQPDVQFDVAGALALNGSALFTAPMNGALMKNWSIDPCVNGAIACSVGPLINVAIDGVPPTTFPTPLFAPVLEKNCAMLLEVLSVSLVKAGVLARNIESKRNAPDVA